MNGVWNWNSEGCKGGGGMRIGYMKEQCIQSGASIPPETMMQFPLFQISPYFLKLFRLWGKFSQFYLFPRNFWWPFFSHRPQISNFPIFPISVHLPPTCFAKIIISPYFDKFPPVLDKFTCLLHTLRVFRFPPTLTVMHLCITQCTYWTPLHSVIDVIYWWVLGSTPKLISAIKA